MGVKEYIEREAAIQVIVEHPYRMAWQTGDAIASVKALPTADVVEVRHGEWEDVGDEFSDLCFRCSACKEEYSCEINMKDFANYCPNCGAKMDGKGEGE